MAGLPVKLIDLYTVSGSFSIFQVETRWIPGHSPQFLHRDIWFKYSRYSVDTWKSAYISTQGIQIKRDALSKQHWRFTYLNDMFFMTEDRGKPFTE